MALVETLSWSLLRIQSLIPETHICRYIDDQLDTSFSKLLLAHTEPMGVLMNTQISQ